MRQPACNTRGNRGTRAESGSPSRPGERGPVTKGRGSPAGRHFIGERMQNPPSASEHIHVSATAADRPPPRAPEAAGRGTGGPRPEGVVLEVRLGERRRDRSRRLDDRRRRGGRRRTEGRRSGRLAPRAERGTADVLPQDGNLHTDPVPRRARGTYVARAASRRGERHVHLFGEDDRLVGLVGGGQAEVRDLGPPFRTGYAVVVRVGAETVPSVARPCDVDPRGTGEVGHVVQGDPPRRAGREPELLEVERHVRRERVLRQHPRSGHLHRRRRGGRRSEGDVRAARAPGAKGVRRGTDSRESVQRTLRIPVRTNRCRRPRVWVVLERDVVVLLVDNLDGGGRTEVPVVAGGADREVFDTRLTPADRRERGPTLAGRETREDQGGGPGRVVVAVEDDPPTRFRR